MRVCWSMLGLLIAPAVGSNSDGAPAPFATNQRIIYRASRGEGEDPLRHRSQGYSDYGHTASFDCCSSTCQPETGACSSDDDLCTIDRCSPAGTCEHTPAIDETCCGEPRACGAAAKAMPSIRQPPSGAPSFRWRLTPQAAVAKADFGYPVAPTSFTPCLFEETSGTLKLLASAPAGPCLRGRCWNETGDGLSYRNRDDASNALRRLGLRGGAAGKAKLTAQAKGDVLALGSMPLELPLRVEIRRSDAPLCRGGELTVVDRNTTERFRGRTP